MAHGVKEKSGVRGASIGLRDAGCEVRVTAVRGARFGLRGMAKGKALRAWRSEQSPKRRVR